jgi:hypothetical protein
MSELEDKTKEKPRSKIIFNVTELNGYILGNYNRNSKDYRYNLVCGIENGNREKNFYCSTTLDFDNLLIFINQEMIKNQNCEYGLCALPYLREKIFSEGKKKCLLEKTPIEDKKEKKKGLLGQFS